MLLREVGKRRSMTRTLVMTVSLTSGQRPLTIQWLQFQDIPRNAIMAWSLSIIGRAKSSLFYRLISIPEIVYLSMKTATREWSKTANGDSLALADWGNDQSSNWGSGDRILFQ